MSTDVYQRRLLDAALGTGRLSRVNPMTPALTDVPLEEQRLQAR
jgi:hypothetical protein